MSSSLGPEPQKDDGGKGRFTLAVDFDGVIHAYTRGYADGTIYDRPVPGAAEALKTLQQNGYRLVVFTARAELDDIRTWLDRYLPDVHFADVTNDKPIASVYIDDRAIRFVNWDQALEDTAAALGGELYQEEATVRAYDARTVVGNCPACGRESLFLGDGGYVTCGYLACQKPDAVSDLLEQDEHFVTFTDTHWSIEHTLACRVQGEMAAGCRWQRAIEEVYGDDPFDQVAPWIGRWVITDIDDEGMPSLVRAPA